ncbi:jg110, partial [Pararge aegeria aegeria]
PIAGPSYAVMPGPSRHQDESPTAGPSYVVMPGPSRHQDENVSKVCVLDI